MVDLGAGGGGKYIMQNKKKSNTVLKAYRLPWLKELSLTTRLKNVVFFL